MEGEGPEQEAKGGFLKALVQVGGSKDGGKGQIRFTLGLGHRALRYESVGVGAFLRLPPGLWLAAWGDAWRPRGKPGWRECPPHPCMELVMWHLVEKFWAIKKNVC